MDFNEEDILEYALNNGIEATKIKFNLSRADIMPIIFKFSRETNLEDKCSCELLWEKGVCMDWCDNCDKGLNKRFKIK
ncbi:MAG TPA: hypothetical protein VN026_18015 [Bacteroidia bacterium]|jgi:hypothetical protein|nr:hypothetical protein [Bacteroidia bacterium]